MTPHDAALPSKPYKIPESVLVVIHTAALQVLLMERADRPGFWQSVTGSKDSPGESLLETAVREVAEETGIVIGSRDDASAGSAGGTVAIDCLRDWQVANVYEIYEVWRGRYAPGVTRNTEHVFSLQVPDVTAITLAPREHLQYCWLPYREAADRCFSASNAEAILQLPQHLTRQSSA